MKATFMTRKVNIAGEKYSKVRLLPRHGTGFVHDAIRPNPCHNCFAMTLRHARRALAIATIAMFVVAAAHAQDVTLPNPDSSYGTTPDQFLTPSDLTMPTVDDAPSPDVVTIPIPGGGEITVDGPDAPSETPLPNLPGSQWGVTQQTPYSHDIGPTLP
jgi:hypothetical protein